MVFAITQSLNDTFGIAGTLKAQMRNSLQNRFQVATQSIADETDSKLSQMGLDRQKWTTVQESIAAAKPKIAAAATSVNSAKGMIAAMQDLLQKAENATDPNDYKSYAQAYQSFVRSMISSLSSGQGKSPLLMEGDGKNNTVSYKTGIGGTEQIEFGRDLVPKYTLSTDTDMWKVNRSQNILQKYAGETALNIAANLVDGIRLDAINGDGTVNFTIGPETGQPITYTNAKMTTSGLDLRDIWYYDGLSTSAGRARALDDLKNLENALTNENIRFQSMMNTADFYETRAKTAISEIDNRGIGAQEEAAAQVKVLQGNFQREAEVLTQAIDNSVSMQMSYANLFKSRSPTKGAKLFDAIIKVTA